MRFYCKCLAAARACASRYHCREAARRLGRPCTLLLGKAGAAWRAGGTNYVRPLPLLPWPSASHLPPLRRRLSAIHHGLAAITIRTEKRRRGARGGTGWAPGGGAATARHRAAARRRGIGLLLLVTADQTVATMLTHNDPITSKDNPITSRNIFSLTFFNLSLELVTYTSLYKSLLEIQFYISFRQLFQARRI